MEKSTASDWASQAVHAALSESHPGSRHADIPQPIISLHDVFIRFAGGDQHIVASSSVAVILLCWFFGFTLMCATRRPEACINSKICAALHMRISS